MRRILSAITSVLLLACASAQAAPAKRDAIGIIEIQIFDALGNQLSKERGSGAILSADGYVLSAGHLFTSETFKVCSAASGATPGMSCRMYFYQKGSASRRYRLDIGSSLSSTHDFVVLKLPRASDVTDASQWPFLFVGPSPDPGDSLSAAGYASETEPDGDGSGNPLSLVPGVLSAQSMPPCADGEGWGVSRVMSGKTAPGYSGGPVLDSRGKLVGIILGRTCPTNIQGAEETRILLISSIPSACSRIGCKQGFAGYIEPYNGRNSRNWKDRLEGGPSAAQSYIYGWKLAEIARQGAPLAMCQGLLQFGELAERLKADAAAGSEIAAVYRYFCQAAQAQLGVMKLGGADEDLQTAVLEMANRGYEPAQYAAAYGLWQSLQPKVAMARNFQYNFTAEEKDTIAQIKRYTDESAAHGWAASLYVRFLYCRLRVTNCEPAIADLEAAVEQDQLEAMLDTAVFALMGDTPQVRQRYNFALPADTARALTLLRSAATPKSGATNLLPFTVYSNQAAGMLAYLYGGGGIGGLRIVAPDPQLAFMYEQQCYGGAFNAFNALHARCAFFGHVTRFNLGGRAADRAGTRDMLEMVAKLQTDEGRAAANILSWFVEGRVVKRISCDLNKFLDLAPDATLKSPEPGVAYCFFRSKRAR